jgi:hypothetical protein
MERKKGTYSKGSSSPLDSRSQECQRMGVEVLDTSWFAVIIRILLGWSNQL